MRPGLREPSCLEQGFGQTESIGRFLARVQQRVSVVVDRSVGKLLAQEVLRALEVILPAVFLVCPEVPRVNRREPESDEHHGEHDAHDPWRSAFRD